MLPPSAAQSNPHNAPCRAPHCAPPLPNDVAAPLSAQAVFAYFYSHVDLTLSDIATALVLVGIDQRMHRLELHHASTSKRQLQQQHPPPPPQQQAPSPSLTVAAGLTAAGASSHLAQSLLDDSPASVASTASSHVGAARLRGAGDGGAGAGQPLMGSWREEEGGAAAAAAAAAAREPVGDDVLVDACHYFSFAVR